MKIGDFFVKANECTARNEVNGRAGRTDKKEQWGLLCKWQLVSGLIVVEKRMKGGEGRKGNENEAEGLGDDDDDGDDDDKDDNESEAS